MSRLCLLSLLLIIFAMHQVQCAKKLKIHWLNNGGRIISTATDDWIRLSIAVTGMANQIYCPTMKGYYNYPAGHAQRFNDLWVAVESDVINFQIQQINVFSRNDGVSINYQLNQNDFGFYQAALTIQQFRQGITIGLQYLGYGVSFTIDSYTRVADYYILVQLVNQQVASDTYGLSGGQCTTFEHFVNSSLLLAMLLLLVIMYS